jgi:4-amino-4-deoxy-L-arabinose transferase
LAAVVFLSGVGAPLPYVNAEGRNGEISQTMYDTGDVLVPRLEGKAHLTKPPLFHWFSYVVSCIRGEGGLVSARAVAAFGAIASVLLTYLLGNRLLGPPVGWYGACMLLSNAALFVHHGHRGSFDTTLAAFILLTLYAYAGLDGERPARAKVLLLVGLVGGFLVKGPIAWLLPAVPMAVDSIGRRGGRKTLRAALLLVPGVLILSLPWYVVLVLRVPEARQVFLDAIRVNFGGRSQTYDMAFHREPFLFYLWQFPLAMLPWAVFLPGLRPRALWNSPDERTRQSSRFLFVFLLWSLLLFTLVPAKAVRYLIPLAPLFSLVVAQWFAERREESPENMPWLRRLWIVQCIFLAVASIALPIWLWARLGEHAPLWAPAGLVLAAVACALWRWRRRVTASLFIGTAVAISAPSLSIAYERWLPKNHYIKEHRHSPERQAYKERVRRLEALFGGHRRDDSGATN